MRALSGTLQLVLYRSRDAKARRRARVPISLELCCSVGSFIIPYRFVQVRTFAVGECNSGSGSSCTSDTACGARPSVRWLGLRPTTTSSPESSPSMQQYYRRAARPLLVPRSIHSITRRGLQQSTPTSTSLRVFTLFLMLTKSLFLWISHACMSGLDGLANGAAAKQASMKHLFPLFMWVTRGSTKTRKRWL